MNIEELVFKGLISLSLAIFNYKVQIPSKLRDF